jgi:polar amino acid transport system substrate-binding protein
VSRHARRASWVGLIVWAAATLGGCASVSDHAQSRSLAALTAKEPGPGPGIDFGTPTKSCEDNPFRSLPPATSLPRPGHMPAGTFMRHIQHEHRLKVGIDQNSLGLGYFNSSNGRMEGFDIDLVREVARAIFGSDTSAIRYEAISTAQRDSVIVNGDVDIVASAYSINCKRRTRMRFSSVYHLSHQKLLVPLNSKVSSLWDPDLRGRKVCATNKSTSLTFLDEMVKQKRTGAVPMGVALRSDCLVLLQEGVVAAITSDDAILLGFRRQDPQTRIAGGSLEPESYGMAINMAHPGFVRFVNAVLLRLRRTGCARVIERHWLTRETVSTHDRSYTRCTGRRIGRPPT